MKGHFKKLSLVGLFSLFITVNVSLVIFRYDAFAQSNEPSVVLRITIEDNGVDYGIDDFGPPSAYGVAIIDGVHYQSPVDDCANLTKPKLCGNHCGFKWDFFSKPILLSKGHVPVILELWDYDMIGPDDQYDLNPGPGNNLRLDVRLNPCSISGDISGNCGSIIESPRVTGDDCACLTIKIEVINAAPDLRVRCLHYPIWPKPGDTVTITAEALDGLLRPRVADSIEIFVNDKTSPVKTESGTTKGSATVGPFTDPTFTYYCKVVDDGVLVSTGWRVVAVGEGLAAKYDGAVPVIYNENRTHSIDIVFHPDKDTFPAGSTGTPFLDAVHKLILNGYFEAGQMIHSADYIMDFMLLNQYRLNFWISKNFGDVTWDPSKGRGCHNLSVDPPLEKWSDSRLVVYDKDCDPSAAMGRFWSDRILAVKQSGLGVLHETGHAVFGLADEYCCDSHYFQPVPLPNIYETEEGCRNDAPKVGRTGDECHKLHDSSDTHTNDWWTSDPDFPDMMGPYHGRPNLLDQRRIDWKFKKCDDGNC